MAAGDIEDLRAQLDEALRSRSEMAALLDQGKHRVDSAEAQCEDMQRDLADAMKDGVQARLRADELETRLAAERARADATGKALVRALQSQAQLRHALSELIRGGSDDLALDAAASSLAAAAALGEHVDDAGFGQVWSQLGDLPRTFPELARQAGLLARDVDAAARAARDGDSSSVRRAAAGAIRVLATARPYMRRADDEAGDRDASLREAHEELLVCLGTDQAELRRLRGEG
ncbi:hypothetical protein FNF29_01726 [Cafeteria roenbergensis]|uniref:Uncharacterized protein n=1 Tax=Cafeteria roenbergensis TaxID=33653 RepID=A0A5A8CU93_CAFRO|nr:hypothetical protein FNF29_01726 [Cafeteria roenbergensis]|eukprot:KAA0155351.1 hypothetical protein FNF29_01726 [Cafeteria roenbergensis]